eukprot:3283423-Alexandrium_andersonii.AAC.1
MCELAECEGAAPAVWKADVDSAYRRVPVEPSHRHLLAVAVRVAGVVWVAEHVALPFGCTGSVHGWDRPGAAVAFLVRKLLRLPALRYVDDYFGAEPGDTAGHALECFGRAVRALLGPTALSDRKMSWGHSE